MNYGWFNSLLRMLVLRDFFCIANLVTRSEGRKAYPKMGAARHMKLTRSLVVRGAKTFEWELRLIKFIEKGVENKRTLTLNSFEIHQNYSHSIGFIEEMKITKRFIFKNSTDWLLCTSYSIIFFIFKDYKITFMPFQ